MGLTTKPENRVKSRTQAYSASCTVCGVAAYISEKTILRLLAKGLESQGFEIVAKEGKTEGTPYGMISPLVAELRRKGIRIL